MIMHKVSTIREASRIFQFITQLRQVFVSLIALQAAGSGWHRESSKRRARPKHLNSGAYPTVVAVSLECDAYTQSRPHPQSCTEETCA